MRSGFARVCATAAWAVVCLAMPGSAQDRRPATFDDVMALRVVESPALSPDGRAVLYTAREWVDARRDGGPDASGRKESRSQVWRVWTTGDPRPRQMTFGDRGATAPGWSPDGRHISFVAARGEGRSDEGPRPQIWILPADGGEGLALTDVTDGVDAYAWSPDSRRIAYVARDPLTAEADTERRRRDDAATFEGDFRYSQLWVVDVASGETTRVTEGAEFTVRGDPAWSPDATRLAFAATPTPMTRDDRSDVYVVTVAGRDVSKITTNPGADASPAWSPDGSTIAYLSDPYPDARPKGDGIPLQHVGNAHLVLHDLRTGLARDVSSPDFDLSPGAPVWSPDGRHVVFTAGARAWREAYAFDVAAGGYVRLTSGRLVSSLSFSRDGTRVAFVEESASTPADVFVADASFVAPRRLTTANPQVEDLAFGESEAITWTSDGEEIEGILLRPIGYEPGRRYPLLVVVHGGPTGAHDAGERLSDGGQVWAGAGWAVLYPNPRGSTNYGESFMRANFGDWGGGDYRDIMTGVDTVIDRGIADPSRLAVMGWSYGGYMTCWIVSQTSRFKAAVMGAGLSNLVSMYGTTDIPDYMGTFFGGTPAGDALPLYRERSGLTWVDRVTTPLLILHGGSDERVPTGQPMEFYRALEDRGKTVELVFYPREGHGLREYYHQLDRLERQFAWITTRTPGDQKQPPQ